MAVYSVNQATQFYVLTEEPTNKGGDNYVRFTGLGAKGDLATDLIAKSKVLSITKTTTAAMAPVIKKTTVKVTTPDAGSYVMRVIITNYFSESPSGAYIKHASAFVKGGDDNAANVAAALVNSLEKSLKRDIEPAFTIDYIDGSDTFTIIPLPTEWIIGKKATTIPNIIVELVPTDDSDIADWANQTIAEADVPADRKLGSEKLADYEYFCLGERGDQYRGAGWPHNIETKGQVDPTVDYNVYTVHYYEDLTNESVQKSEKTVVFASTTDLSGTLDGIFGVATT